MKLKIVVLSTLASIGLHIYLTIQHFSLVLGASTGDSSCNVGSMFDCNAATASAYSKIAGIPVSVWGASTNIILLIFLALFFFGFSNRSLFYAYILTAISAAASLTMAGISTFLLSSYCLYCLILYVLSFVNFPLVSMMTREEDGFELGEHLKNLFGKGLYETITFASILPIAFFINYSFITKYEAGDLSNLVKHEVNRWKVIDQVEFSATAPTLKKGAEDSKAKMIITEFADFRCGHCKYASAPISAFVKAHSSDVQLNFYVFPLDGACNEAISRASGLSCLIAKTVYCAGQQDSEKGWNLHDLVFENQEDINQTANIDALQEKLGKLASKAQLNLDSIKTCTESDEAHQAMLSQGKLGVDSKVQGTPTVFVNGKKLQRGQLIPVLEGVYNAIKAQ